jgi:hypothetical protein
MKILKIIGFGALIYAVAFVVVSAFIGFQIPSDNLAVKLATIGCVLLTIILAAKSLKVSSAKEMLGYSFIWVIINLLLDILITARFTGWAVFGQWNILLGYLLILIVPLLAVRKQ